MKNTLIIMMISLSLNAFADQKSIPMKNTVLQLEGTSLIARGDAGRDSVAGRIQLVNVRGTVAGKVCTQYSCSGRLVIVNDDVVIDAYTDSDSDGRIDATEKKVVGQLVGGQVEFDVPADFVYVIQRYSLAERMLGQRNSEWVALSLHL